MEQDQTQREHTPLPKWLNRVIIGMMVSTILVTGWAMKEMVPEMYRSIKQKRYAIEHLDSNAVSPKKSPFVNGFTRWGGVVYEDQDKDGDYESILKRKNSDGKFIDIPMEYGLDGRIKFMNLSETAVDPLNIPKNPWGLELDYVDIDGDGKLESIAYFGSGNEEPQRIKIERIDGNYIFSNF